MIKWFHKDCFVRKDVSPQGRATLRLRRSMKDIFFKDNHIPPLPLLFRSNRYAVKQVSIFFFFQQNVNPLSPDCPLLEWNSTICWKWKWKGIELSEYCNTLKIHFQQNSPLKCAQKVQHWVKDSCRGHQTGIKCLCHWNAPFKDTSTFWDVTQKIWFKSSSVSCAVVNREYDPL